MLLSNFSLSSPLCVEAKLKKGEPLSTQLEVSMISSYLRFPTLCPSTPLHHKAEHGTKAHLMEHNVTSLLD